jgi:2-methylaconitate cis-trans-isomerase PrpF
VDADHDLSARLEKLRVEAAARMGMAESAAVPKIAFVAPPADYTALDGVRYGARDFDVLGRAISMGNCHRAFPLTVAMCLAVAANIPGTVVNECLPTIGAGADDLLDRPTHASTRAGATRSNSPRYNNSIRLGHPSGTLPIAANVTTSGAGPKAETVTVYRTARRLMEGFVRVP